MGGCGGRADLGVDICTGIGRGKVGMGTVGGGVAQPAGLLAGRKVQGASREEGAFIRSGIALVYHGQ